MNIVKPVFATLTLGVGGLTVSETPPNPLKAHEEPARAVYYPTVDMKPIAGSTSTMSLITVGLPAKPSDGGVLISGIPIW